MKKVFNKKSFLIPLLIIAGFGFSAKAEAAAPAFVQKNENLVFSGSSVSTTLNGIVAHHALVVGIYWNSATVSLTSVTDNCSEPQTYTLLDNPTAKDGAHGAVAYNYNVTGGNCTVTANFSGAIAEAKIWVHEISGISTTDPIDGHNTKVDTYRTTTCTDCITSNSITTTTNGDYIFGLTMGSNNPVLNAGTNYTKRSSGNSRGMTEDLVQSSAGSVTATFSRADTTANTNFSFVMALKPDVQPDTTPPIISGGSPSGLLSRTTSNATLQVATNEDATCKFSTTPDTTYATMTGTFTTANNRAHSTTTPVTSGNTYNYYVRCQDTAGNPNISDYTITFTVSNGTASTCSQADVQAEINLASDGDVVTVPAGTCTYTTTVAGNPSININKAITLQGQTTCTGKAGTLSCTDNTTISDGTGSNYREYPIQISAANARVTGLTFTGGDGSTWPFLAISDVNGWRVDHNHFIPTQTTNRGIQAYGYGLVDHNYFVNDGNGVSIYGGHGADATYAGDTSWTQAMDLGTANAVYIEDNEFDYTQTLDGAYDAYSGARVVFRYNDVKRTNIGGHGMDTGGDRSTLLQEVYNNTFANSGSHIYQWFSSRGGSHLVFNNTIGSAGGSYDLFTELREYRQDNGYSFGDVCMGTNPIDGNTSGQYGWPCMDQVGRGTNQASYPGYSWGNSFKGSVPTLANFHISNSANSSMPNTVSQYQIVNNRDFFNEVASFNGTNGVGVGLLSARPSTCTIGVGYWATNTDTLYTCSSTNTWSTYYTPYTYPHPLQNATTFTISGTVSGLSSTLVLQNNGGDNKTVTSDGSFTFDTPLANSASYAVTVLTQPIGQTCTITNGSGTVTSANVINVVVTCISSIKAITAFDFNGLSPTVTGTVNEGAKTVLLTVPYGTAVTALVPTITITGSSVSPNTGVAANFSTPQTYTVTAADSSTQAYIVTVTVSAAPVVVSSSGGNGAPVGLIGQHRQDISSLLSQTVTPTPNNISTTSQPNLSQYTFSRNISLHATGTDIKNLQKLLNSLGFTISKTGAGSPGKETTLFGSLTYKALQKFQKSAGLPATGYFGPMTREYLRTH